MNIRSLCLIVILILTFTLTGCAADSDTDADAVISTEQTSEPIPEQPPVEETAVNTEFSNTDVGNTIGNIINGGWVAYANDMVYIAMEDEELGFGIFKTRQGSSERKLLLSAECMFINVLDDVLYFVNISDGGVICSMNINGTDLKRLNNADSEYAHVMGDWIYYINRDDYRRVYRLAIDGSVNTAITDYMSKFVFAGEGYVFYQRINPDNYKDSAWELNITDPDPFDVVLGETELSEYFELEGELFRIDPDGSNKTIISYDICHTAHIEDDTLYFLSIHGSIHKVPMDLRGQKMQIGGILSWADHGCFTERSFYFSIEIPHDDFFEYGKIYRLDLKTVETEMVIAGPWADNVNIAGEAFYYHDISKYRAAHRMNLDGTENTVLEGSRIPILTFTESTLSDPDDPTLSALSLTAHFEAVCYKLLTVGANGREAEFRTVYLNPNSKCIIRFPAGIYVLKTAKGTHWLGDDFAFGDDGIYNSTNPFEFEAGVRNSTILGELTVVQSISVEDFVG